jgi:hypothetical protein
MALVVPADRTAEEGPERVYFNGLWYVDELVRTPEGWRIRHRSEDPSYRFNRPAWVRPTVS